LSPPTSKESGVPSAARTEGVETLAVRTKRVVRAVDVADAKAAVVEIVVIAADVVVTRIKMTLISKMMMIAKLAS
jgi:hypothetical protein